MQQQLELSCAIKETSKLKSPHYTTELHDLNVAAELNTHESLSELQPQTATGFRVTMKSRDVVDDDASPEQLRIQFSR
jgi:hypothetical protein